jgi:hypothetical protein
LPKNKRKKSNFGLETTTTTEGEESFQVIGQKSLMTYSYFISQSWLVIVFLTLIFAWVQGRVSITYQLGIELNFL